MKNKKQPPRIAAEGLQNLFTKLTFVALVFHNTSVVPINSIHLHKRKLKMQVFFAVLLPEVTILWLG